jgi:hypothetical protein
MTTQQQAEDAQNQPPVVGTTTEQQANNAAGTVPDDFVDTPTVVADPSVGGSSVSFIDRLRVIFPAMPIDFINAAADAWAANADFGFDVAVATLRSDSRYEVWFPGNRAPDGSVHLLEGAYWQTRRQHADVISQLGLNANVFDQALYISLITGDVDVVEFEARVRSLSNQILARSDGIREYYAEQFGALGVSDSAILESAFSGNSDAIRRSVGTATVGFEGVIRGFDVSLGLASSLFDANITTQGQATELFGQAASQVPLFGRLAERHFDPDDTFDLGEFIEASVFNDQEQLSRINRLLSQERSQFSAFRPLRGRRGEVEGLVPG